MITRQSELVRVLDSLTAELPDPHWVAIVDSEGLIVACVPSEPPVEEDRISAMTAAILLTAQRVLTEIEGGDLRYANVAGSARQYLMVALGHDRYLSVGLEPQVPVQTAFGPLSRRVPELVEALQKRFTVG